MKNIFKRIVLTLFLSTSLYSSDILENTFIDISIGLSHSPYSKKDITGNIAIDSLDENGYLYDLAIGYRFNNNIFTTLNYQYTKLNEIDFDEYYVTLNYQFDYKFNPYIGALVGKSFLHWNKDPLNSSQNIDWASGSFMYGVQAGLQYGISDKISFIPKLMYIRTDHGTNLILAPAQSFIEYDDQVKLLFGLRYIY